MNNMNQSTQDNRSRDSKRFRYIGELMRIQEILRMYILIPNLLCCSHDVKNILFENVNTNIPHDVYNVVMKLLVSIEAHELNELLENFHMVGYPKPPAGNKRKHNGTQSPQDGSKSFKVETATASIPAPSPIEASLLLNLGNPRLNGAIASSSNSSRTLHVATCSDTTQSSLETNSNP